MSDQQGEERKTPTTDLESRSLPELRDKEGRKVRLKSIDRKSLQEAWDAYHRNQSRFAIAMTRTNYRAVEESGRRLVETQTRLGVWVIHPINAGPGLRVDDPRILED